LLRCQCRATLRRQLNYFGWVFPLTVTIVEKFFMMTLHAQIWPVLHE
jgi:hypothetical protein